MRVRLGVAVIGAVLLLGTAALAKETGKGDDVRTRLLSAFEKVQKGDCPGTLTLITPLLEPGALDNYNDATKSAAFGLGAACSADHDPATAYKYALAATALETANSNAWGIRLWLEMREKRHADAVKTVETMAERQPEALNAIGIQAYHELSMTLRRDDKDKPLRKRLLAALSGPVYQPMEITASPDSFRQAYAGMLADDGDKAGASKMIALIEEPSLLIRTSVDPRLRFAVPVDFDARAAVEKALTKARDVAAAHAASMAAVLEVARYLRMLGRPQEALATLEAAQPEGAARESFDDLSKWENWWWDAMARSYQTLGRYDDTIRAYSHAVDAKEAGGLNVSQTINLAYAHMAFGKWDKAVATVADFEKGDYAVSPYGLMQMRGVRGCSRFLLGRTAEAKADLDYVVAHEMDDPSSLTWLALCANEMDMAAASVIRRLDNPDRRAQALLDLSDYADAPESQPELPFEDRYDALTARADVKAAIERAGGTRTFNVQASEF
jgi:tetratricopeptide (TPR) repeat protein